MNIKDHLEKLVYFDEVANLGSIKLASERLHITQPSLSKSIKVLEEVIGVELFTRQARGVDLTIQGEVLHKFTQNLLSQLKDTEAKLSHPESLMAGLLRLGTYDSIAIHFWPVFLRGFLKKYPKLNLKLQTGRSFQIQKMVEDGELDVGLIVGPQKSGQTEVELIAKDSFHFFEASHHETIYENIDDAPLILMPESVIAGGSQLGDFLKMHEIENYYSTSSLESVKELTANGLGIGLLPQSVAMGYVEKSEIKEVEYRDFGLKGISEHEIGLVYHYKTAKIPQIQTLIEEIKQTGYPYRG